MPELSHKMSQPDDTLSPGGQAVLDEIRQQLARAAAMQTVVDDLVRSATETQHRPNGAVVVTTTSRAWDAISTLARP